MERLLKQLRTTGKKAEKKPKGIRPYDNQSATVDCACSGKCDDCW